MSCSSQWPLAGAGQRSRADGRRCTAPSRRGAARASFSICVRTFMPAATGVVHEAGIALACLRSRTRHRRQEPNALSVSVAHSFGIDPFDAGAAPAGAHDATVPRPATGDVGLPSIVRSVISLRALRLRRARGAVGRRDRCNACVDLIRRWRFSAIGPRAHHRAARPKVFREMLQRAQHRERRHAAQRAQRSVRHGLAQIVQQLDVLVALDRRARMRSITSTPRVEPMRHGVHLPQDSIAQNSIA